MIDPYFELYTAIVLKITVLSFVAFAYFIAWRFFYMEAVYWGKKGTLTRRVIYWFLSDNSPTFKAVFSWLVGLGLIFIILNSYYQYAYYQYAEIETARSAYITELKNNYDKWAKEYPINYEAK